MSTPLAQLLSKTVSGFFNTGEVRNEVCKIARQCAKTSVVVPAPPETGTYTLKVVDGTLEWVEEIV